MSAERDDDKFAQLVNAIGPYLDRVVIVGGWAHRLFRLHPLPRVSPSVLAAGPAFERSHYSAHWLRNAVSGSIRVARRAGSHVAPSATEMSSNTATANVAGSSGVRP